MNKNSKSKLEKAVSWMQGVTTFENPGHTWRCVGFNRKTRVAKYLCIDQTHDHEKFYIHQEWKGAL